MSAPFTRSVVCPVLVGRASHLGLLADLLEQARAGTGHSVLLSGEAGVGKSRLAAELRALSVGQSAVEERPQPLAVEGRCFEQDRDGRCRALAQ